MNIHQAQITAQEQFLILFRDASAIDVIQKYARCEPVAKSKRKLSVAKSFEKKLKKKTVSTEEFNSFYTWFYINYVANKKNGWLRTETAINVAFIHFLENKHNQPPAKIYELFAREELQMTEISVARFAAKVNFEVVEDENEMQGFDIFYTWYYINYIVKSNA